MSGSKERIPSSKAERRDAPSPLDISATFQQALACHQQNHMTQAKLLYQQVVKKVPDHFDALNLLGALSCQEGDFEAAVQHLRKALKVDPGQTATHSNLGFALRKLKRHREALACFDRALAIAPDFADARYNRGCTLLDLGLYEEALADCDHARAAMPNSAPILCNHGNALIGLKRHQEALDSYDRALALVPNYPEALHGRGDALHGLKRHAEALASYDRALALKPSYADVLNNRGIVLSELGRLDEALASYDRALLLKPDWPDALNNRGMALSELGRYEEATSAFDRLLRSNATMKYAAGDRLHWQLHCCDWQDYSRRTESIIAKVVAGAPAIKPFPFLSVSDSPADQLKCAQIYCDDKYPSVVPTVWQGERYRHKKIRIAYLSADFHNHATAYLMAGFFEKHDKSRFETFAISFGPDVQDESRRRVTSAFSRFIDVRHMTDRAVALLLKDMEIDIAVDLKGHTGSSRLGIFAFRPAPIQVNYLGYPGTIGAEYIDYILADRIVIPEEQRRFYTEEVAYLPDSYQPNDVDRPIREEAPTRMSVGLPAAGFVFCAFNNRYKFTPPVFDVWMRLLRQVEGSVLWMLDGGAAAMRNLRQSAEKRGVAGDRLVFAPRLPLESHLARHGLADLFLDNLPYNAHTTASDALRCGVPIVTCLGSTFAGRVAASLLHAVRLPEMITETLDAYEALALALARDPIRLAGIKAKLARNRQSAPLFDTEGICRHVEKAYALMWERYQRGEPPESFAVAPN